MQAFGSIAISMLNGWPMPPAPPTTQTCQTSPSGAMRCMPSGQKRCTVSQRYTSTAFVVCMLEVSGTEIMLNTTPAEAAKASHHPSLAVSCHDQLHWHRNDRLWLCFKMAAHFLHPLWEDMNSCEIQVCIRWAKDYFFHPILILLLPAGLKTAAWVSWIVKILLSCICVVGCHGCL